MRVPPGNERPHTRSSSRSRDITMPGWASRKASRSNSIAGQLDLAPGDGDGAARVLQDDVAGGDEIVVRIRLGPPQDGAHPRHELAR